MKYIITFMLLTISQGVLSNTIDYIDCMREKAEFRQFCYIDESTINTELIVNRYSDIGSDILDLLPVYESASIELNRLNHEGKRRLSLISLAPYIKADIDWVKSQECLVSELWFDRVFLVVRDEIGGETRNIDNIRIGLNSYDVNLDIYNTENFSPWTISALQNGEVKISAESNIKNLDHSEDRPLAYQRIPTYCKLNVSNYRIGFDALQMYRDLDNLEIQSDSVISLKTRSSVLNASLIDGQRGAICSVYKLGERLKDIEFAWDWNDLTYESRELISDGIKEAINVGAISENDLPSVNDYFGYFVSDEFQNSAIQLCANINQESYAVDPDLFVDNGEIVNRQGYDNAVVYQKASENLIAILKAAWAINNVAVKEIEDYVQREWLTDPATINSL
ncbi:hypothetical protein [Bermanella sp. R86510]|uniref:hypothetical protein n=1 Tax=unclassified Bermanella TaxID=2627862 RepID=UPI0037C6409E